MTIISQNRLNYNKLINLFCDNIFVLFLITMEYQIRDGVGNVMFIFCFYNTAQYVTRLIKLC